MLLQDDEAVPPQKLLEGHMARGVQDPNRGALRQKAPRSLLVLSWMAKWDDGFVWFVVAFLFAWVAPEISSRFGPPQQAVTGKFAYTILQEPSTVH